MPSQPTWQNLLKTTSPLITMATAGCAASNLLQMQGGDMILGGGLAALGFGAAAATTNVLSGVIANRFHDQSKLRAFDPQSLLQNRHLHKLTALAIKAKLLEAAHDEASFLPPNVARLKKMAKHIEADWQELPATLAVHLAQQQLVNDDLQHWFLEARDNPHPTALTVEHWTDYLRALGIKHDCELDADKLALMAERLHFGLPVAVRELLKDDFAHGGEAFAALLLRMLADLYGAVQDVQRQTGGDPALLGEMRQLRTTMRLIGRTMTERFDELPTRGELLPLLDEIKQAAAEHHEQDLAAHAATQQQVAVLHGMIERALTTGERPMPLSSLSRRGKLCCSGYAVA